MPYSANLRSRLASLNRNRKAPRQSRRAETASGLIEGDVLRCASGTCLRIRKPVRSTLPRQRLSWLEKIEHLGDELGSGAVSEFVRSFPSQVVFLDLETCGFSGTPVFLVGAIVCDEQELYVDQYLARTYAEEKPILEAILGQLSNSSVLVSFNGKTFDWPFLRDRLVFHRLLPPDYTGPLFKAHFDLLHPARKIWKRPLGLPDCRLQTLEAALCKRFRQGDIPGFQIAPAYHDFVRGGDPGEMFQILQHNLLDLVTLLELSLLMVAELLEPAGDWFGRETEPESDNRAFHPAPRTGPNSPVTLNQELIDGV